MSFGNEVIFTLKPLCFLRCYCVYIFFSFLSAKPVVLVYKAQMKRVKQHFHNFGNVNMLHSFLWKNKRNGHGKHILI